MTITAYDRSQWERVHSAFSEYLAKRRDYSRQKRLEADTELADRQAVLAENARQHRSFNPHLFANEYSRTRLSFRHGAERKLNTVNLTHHANGTPIEWRVEPLELSADDKLYFAQLQLAA